jgi:hypothetical protein
MQDRCVTILKLAEEVGINNGSLYSVSTNDLAMQSVRKIHAKAGNNGAEVTPRSKKARQVRSNIKVMLTVFFESRGMVHDEYVPQDQNINLLAPEFLKFF